MKLKQKTVPVRFTSSSRKHVRHLLRTTERMETDTLNTPRATGNKHKKLTRAIRSDIRYYLAEE